MPNHMRFKVTQVLFAGLVGTLMMFTSLGCESDSSSERFEKEAKRVEREVNRELERAADDLADAQKQLEKKLDRHLSDEELEKLTEEIQNNVESGMAKVGEALERIGSRLKEDSKVEVVNYNEFKALLPKRVEGFDLVDLDGSNKSALGIRFSKLEAQYENADDDIDMEIAILDLGTMKGLTTMGFDWMDREIKNEDIDGFERTTKFGGYPGFESAQYRGSFVNAQGVAIVENRFVVAVNIKGESLDKDLMEKVFDEFSFRKLRQMAE
jgi:hypothetical protein